MRFLKKRAGIGIVFLLIICAGCSSGRNAGNLSGEQRIESVGGSSETAQQESVFEEASAEDIHDTKGSTEDSTEEDITETVEKTKKKRSLSERFDDLLTRLFVEMVKNDTVTAHYTLKHPEKYNIEFDEVTLGDYDEAFSDEKHELLLDYYNELMDYGEKLDKLDSDQRITYRVIEDYMKIRLDYDKEEYFYFAEPLKPRSGTQSMLPVSMVEFTIENKEDAEIYMELLKCIPDYLGQISAYEKAKSAAGLFMSDESADEVIASCQSFINDTDNNMLITSFASRIKDIPGLSADDIKNYERTNADIIINEVIPAYNDLIDVISSLKGTGKNDLGICFLPKGTEYYQYLIRTKTGTDMTPEELLAYLEKIINDDYEAFLTLSKSDNDTFQMLTSDISLYLGEPEDMLASLQDIIKDEYPEAVTEKYELNYVPEELEGSMSPAFYLIPPVDDPDQNIIYLNRSQLSDTLRMFKTLAHEGYPGHLYQQTYFSAQDPPPIRKELSMLGYVEGWATYAELNSYDWVGLNSTFARARKLNDELFLTIYAYADVNIHCCGWTEDDLRNYLTFFNIYDEQAVHSLYRIIIGDPGGYLPYAVGNMQIRQLRQTAEETEGEDFDPVKFHKFLLDIGPCQFYIIKDYFEDLYHPGVFMMPDAA